MYLKPSRKNQTFFIFTTFLNLVWLKILHLNHFIDGPACTAELKETEKGTTSHLLEVIEVLNENVKNLKSEMKQLAAENQATGKLLRALADQNSIYLDDLDSFDWI